MTLVSRPPNITYVELGKTLTLNVTYETSSNVVVTWSKNAKILITSDLGPNDPRASIKGQGTLVLINTTSSDNGIYKHQARTLTSTEDIELVVVIQGKYSKYMLFTGLEVHTGKIFFRVLKNDPRMQTKGKYFSVRTDKKR